MNWNDKVTVLDKINDWILTYATDIVFVMFCAWVVMYVLTIILPLC